MGYTVGETDRQAARQTYTHECAHVNYNSRIYYFMAFRPMPPTNWNLELRLSSKNRLDKYIN